MSVYAPRIHARARLVAPTVDIVVVENEEPPNKCEGARTLVCEHQGANTLHTDGEGFEPPALEQCSGFQNRYLKPLRHPSLAPHDGTYVICVTGRARRELRHDMPLYRVRLYSWLHYANHPNFPGDAYLTEAPPKALKCQEPPSGACSTPTHKAPGAATPEISKNACTRNHR